MPHIVIEHSTNVGETHDMSALCRAVFDTAKASGVFPDTTAIKVRAIAYDHFVIGTDPQSFAHATIHLLAGRSPAVKAALTQTILDEMEKHLPTVGSLSVDIVDMDPPAQAKRIL